MDNIEIIKNISFVLGALLNLSAVASLIIKPIREKLIDFIKKVTNSQQKDDLIIAQSKALAEQKENIETINSALVGLSDKLEDLADKLLLNERDRLRGELFNCGSRCRRGVALSFEEFRYIQGVYEKYSDELHQNSIGTDEYHFIRDYYEAQNLAKLK